MTIEIGHLFRAMLNVADGNRQWHGAMDRLALEVILGRPMHERAALTSRWRDLCQKERGGFRPPVEGSAGYSPPD